MSRRATEAGTGNSVAATAYTDVLGLHISAVTMGSTIAVIEGWIAEDAREYVCICTVHGVMEAKRNPRLQAKMNEAGLRTPDGMPLVWLSKLAGHHEVERVYGPDVMLALCAQSAKSAHRHFFYGGMPGVAEELSTRLKARFPKLEVAGLLTPSMLQVEEIASVETIQRINEANADIVWVGLSTPKQDWWVANHRSLLNAPVLIAVGAAFDFHSGRVRQAPTWMQRSGLEWLFRVSQDPRRLWSRYAVFNTLFLWELIKAGFGRLTHHRARR